jgi:hypothetical protein
MPVMSPGPIKWAHGPALGLLVIFLMCRDTLEEVNNSPESKDWLMTCCGDEPIRENRTLVTLGYLTAVLGDLRNRLVLAITN